MRSVRSGQLPLWNPYVGLGRPFLADIETAAFYPPNLLYFLLDPHTALALLLAAHVALALLSTLALCRHLGTDPAVAWIVGLAFMGSGAVVGALHRGQIPYGQATAYLPLLLLLAARLQDRLSLRRVGQLALALALQLLCGHPQMAWMSGLVLAVFLTGRALRAPVAEGVRTAATGLLGLALGAGWAFALAAVQLLPFLELVAQGNRAGASVEFASAGSLRWTHWLSLFVPARLDGPVPLGNDLYVGPLLVLAGLCGLSLLEDRNVRGLSLVLLLSVLIAAGERTPAFRILYSVVPGLSSFRFPARMGLVACFALLLAAGIFLSVSVPPRRILVLLAVCSLSLLAATVWWQARLLAPGDRHLATFLGRSALIVASAAVIGLWPRRSRLSPRSLPWLLGLLAALALGDIAASIARTKGSRGGPGPFPGEKVVAQTLARSGLLEAKVPPPRICVPFPIIRDNSGMLWGFGNFSGYVALTLDSVWVYIHEALGLTPSLDANTYPSADIYDFGPFPYRTMSLVLGFDPQTSGLVMNRDPDPRAYLVPAAEVVPELREAVARMRSGHDPHRTALLASPPGFALGPGAPGAPSTAEVVSFEPGRMALRAETSHPALLVVAEAWYPGWRAFVNGREVPCLRANAWMRAVVVPQGRSEVLLLFRSTYLGTGALVSAVSAILLGFALRRKRERPRSTKGRPFP